jgi:putative intracellular protease/amidase
MNTPRILIVVTSHGELGNTGKKTGFWLEELAVPYLALTRAGAHVDIASPLGGRPPADPASEKSDHEDVRAFLDDREAMRKLSSTLRIDDVKNDYDAIFVAGGHGVMWDLATSASVAELVSSTYRRGAVVAAVCHGPAALVKATKEDGTPIVSGHRFAAFSNEEEEAAGLTTIMPFLLESTLRDQGGNYERGPIWKPFAVRDGRLVTGQNPASSKVAAEETLAAIRANA